jgi:aminotransferase EvaB
MKNFYPQQYEETGQFPINHNYLPKQFENLDTIWQKVRNVVIQGDFTLGSAVDQFEKSFAGLNGGGKAVGVGSGTDALFLSLKALGIGEGDEVITTAFTFYATIGAIVTAGAKPVFVDICDDFNIDASKIEAAITPRTKAIMPVHWSGNPCDMEAIGSIARKYQIKVIADACHAIEATYQSKGMSEWSDLTCFSMHPLKNLNVWGDGGVTITHDDALHEKVLLLRNHGLRDRDHCDVFAYNSRLDTIQAVVAQHLIDEQLSNITKKRIENSLHLDQGLKYLDQVSLPQRANDKKHVFHIYMGLYEERDELITYLQQQGIDAKIHYPIPMHLQPAAEYLGHQKGDFPIAEKVADQCMSLPVHEYITLEELDFMVKSVADFYNNR